MANLLRMIKNWQSKRREMKAQSEFNAKEEAVKDQQYTYSLGDVPAWKRVKYK